MFDYWKLFRMISPLKKKQTLNPHQIPIESPLNPIWSPLTPIKMMVNSHFYQFVGGSNQHLSPPFRTSPPRWVPGNWRRYT